MSTRQWKISEDLHPNSNFLKSRERDGQREQKANIVEEENSVRQKPQSKSFAVCEAPLLHFPFEIRAEDKGASNWRCQETKNIGSTPTFGRP